MRTTRTNVRAGALPIMLCLTLTSALAACSLSSSDFADAGQRIAQDSPGTRSAVAPQPAAQPDPYDQAVIDAYPSKSLLNLLARRDAPPPMQVATVAPQSTALTAAALPNTASTAAALPPAPGPAPLPLSAYAAVPAPVAAGSLGAAPALAAAASPAAPPDEHEQAVIDAYPSVSLVDVLFGSDKSGSH